jgi:hypothetical protein
MTKVGIKTVLKTVKNFLTCQQQYSALQWLNLAIFLIMEQHNLKM